MNYQINISPLTKTQIRNLGKGKGVRVYAGNSPIEVDKKQFTRFNRNMRLGKAFTLKLTAKQGKGIFGDAYRYIKQNPALRGMANRVISSGKAAAHYGINKATDYAHRGINRGAEYAHGKIRDFPLISGSGMKRRTRRGKGLVGGVLSGSGELAGMIGGPGSDEAKKWLQGIGTVANVFGLGMKRKKASPAQLKALALGRAIRDANRGKVGSGRKKIYRGSALLPAGY